MTYYDMVLLRLGNIADPAHWLAIGKTVPMRSLLQFGLAGTELDPSDQSGKDRAAYETLHARFSAATELGIRKLIAARLHTTAREFPEQHSAELIRRFSDDTEHSLREIAAQARTIRASTLDGSSS